mgnify:CR=1 FL=1
MRHCVDEMHSCGYGIFFSSWLNSLENLVMTGEPASFSSRLIMVLALSLGWFWIKSCMSSVFSSHVEEKKIVQGWI